jgi:chemotaxis signal transduction protein
MIEITSSLEQTAVKEANYPWVIISISNMLFGLTSKMVTSMELLPTITEIPHSPNYMRGMVETRGKMHPLIDARVKLGFINLKDEMQQLSNLFMERRKDHENWLNELEASVKESRAFRLTTDPHQCKFGKWYDKFKSDNFAFQHLLNKFKEPHEKIHKVAINVTELVMQGNTDSAQKLVDRTRDTTLSEMIHLFERASSLVLEETREIMLVLELNGKDFALTVDTVVSVEYLAKDSVQDIPTSSSEEAQFSSKIGKRANGKDNVILLDFNKIDIDGITNLITQN